MDYDGANVQYLTDSSSIVLAPRFSPTGDRILFTSYTSGFPAIYLMDVGSLQTRSLGEQPGTMTFAPRFSPDGGTVVFSLEQGGNSDIYAMDVNGGGLRQLTNAPSIETAPSFSPDGSQIVFESDRSGNQQLYIMSAGGGDVHPRNRGCRRAGAVVLGRRLGPQPETGADRWPGVRPGLVAAFAVTRWLIVALSGPLRGCHRPALRRAPKGTMSPQDTRFTGGKEAAKIIPNRAP
jgi:dipeptidyl aminopeptidase/acylaminoacyl peptidase